MKVAVIDGQGGGIGKAIIERLRGEFGEDLHIIALGSNSIATSVMLKAGANEGASGDNAIGINASKVDIIIGCIGIIVPNSMLGEITPMMANSIAESPAKKVLIPLNRSNIQVAGIKNEPLPHYIDYVIDIVKNYMRGE